MQIPQRLAGFTVNQSRRPEWTQAFNELSKIARTGYVAGIIGGYGTGKSQLGASLCKYYQHHYYQEGREPVMIEASELFSSIKDTFGTGETTGGVFKRFMRPSLLVIDELNTALLSEYDTITLQRVISRRYDTAAVDTVLISNKTHDAFAETVGDRVISRINDTAGVYCFEWPSFRKNG